MTRSRAGALAVLLAVAVAGPARAQVDTEEERQREEERERRVEKSIPAWRYELLRRERDRSRLKGKTELGRLVESARLFSLVGKDPPPFTLPRADGARGGLSDFTGEVVMLYFWSTASTYASAELASTIHKLQRELQASHFTVLAVDTREKPEDVAAWMKGRAFSPVLLLDRRRRHGHLQGEGDADDLPDRPRSQAGRPRGRHPLVGGGPDAGAPRLPPESAHSLTAVRRIAPGPGAGL